jgi:hypothetical protein
MSADDTTALSVFSRLDPDLPGAALLAGLPDLAPHYLRYKPGTSLVAMLDTALGPAMAYATSPQAAPKLAKLAAHAPAGSILLHDSRARLLVALPVADRDLPGLRRRIGPGARTFAYKPQRRWVGLPADAGPDSPVWRCYRRGDLERIRHRWPSDARAGDSPTRHAATGARKSVASAAGAGTTAFRVPEIVRASPRHDVLRIARVDGTGLDELLAAGDGADVGPAALNPTAALDLVRRTGRALALWHRRPLPSLPADPGSDPDAAATLLARLLPDRAPQIQGLATRLREAEARLQGSSAGRSPDLVWCHGDFSTDQVLVGTDGALWLMDWDRSGAGPRATDLASAEAAGLPPAARTALLEGYTSAADLPADLDLARARALFSRAADPFRRADPDWPALVTTRLDAVQELLP